MNEVKYIDEQKTVCMISGKYLSQLTGEVAAANKSALDQTGNKLRKALADAEKARTEFRAANERAQQLEQLFLQAVETNGLLEQELKRSNTELVTQRGRLAELFANERIQRIDHVPVRTHQPIKDTESHSVQTEYWEPKIELITKI